MASDPAALGTHSSAVAPSGPAPLGALGAAPLGEASPAPEHLGTEALAAPWGPPWTAEAIITHLEPMVLERRRERLLEVINARVGSVTLLLDELFDPHNRAAIVRSCDAFGVQELHTVQPGNEFSLSSIIAAGSERWVDVLRHPSPEVATQHLLARGFELVETHPKGELTPDELAALPRVALILGNEHRGVDAALSRAATRRVRIPMRGFVESLNVSVCAAVLLQSMTRGRAGDLPPLVREHLYARALFQTVPRATRVLDALGSRFLR